MDMGKKDFLRAMCFRHACKLFDNKREVSSEDEDFLLEIGRLSPSSMGLEHWKFVVVRDPELKSALQLACMDQPQVGSASLVIVILARTADLLPTSEYVARMLRRLAPTESRYRELSDFYRDYTHQIDLAGWSIAQCHIAAANLMTAAAFIGIDSCPIGAFDAKKIQTVLKVDATRYQTALVLPFGYRKNAQPPLHRLPLAEIVEFR
jgi:nitroreductase